MKQDSHRYSLGNGHIDLHDHNQLAEHTPDPDLPPLPDHMRTHLQHLPPIPNPGEPPPWIPEGMIYNSTGQAYHYTQPLTTMAYIRGGHADTALVKRLQHELQTALSTLDTALLPVHLQTRRAQLLLQQLTLLGSVAPWYDRRGINITPEYTN